MRPEKTIHHTPRIDSYHTGKHYEQRYICRYILGAGYNGNEVFAQEYTGRRSYQGKEHHISGGKNGHPGSRSYILPNYIGKEKPCGYIGETLENLEYPETYRENRQHGESFHRVTDYRPDGENMNIDHEKHAYYGQPGP